MPMFPPCASPNFGRRHGALLTLLLPLAGFGCASQDEAASSDRSGGLEPAAQPSLGAANAGASFQGAPGAGNVTGSGGSSAAGVPALPDEVETNVEFELPHAGDRYVYAANPESDSVAVIDSETLGIQTVEAGDGPTFLQTLGGTDAAVVLNVGSDDATIIRTKNGVSTTTSVDVQPGSNAIAVSKDGRHAVVYFNADHRSVGSTGSFQDLSVLTLDADGDLSTGMTVGFRPSQVSFSEDGKFAFVVTEDGTSILDFAQIKKGGAGIANTVSLGNDADARSLDVSVTPDGAYALARRENDSALRLANLKTEELLTLDLNAHVPLPEVAITADGGVPDAALVVAPVTDVDLAPNGKFALAVVRDFRTVLKVPIPEAFTDPSTIIAIQFDKEIIGSVSISPDSKRALLYTTVVDDNERISILDIEEETFEPVRLPKAVQAITIAPDSETALIVHRKLAGDPNQAGISPDELIDRSFGYSVLKLATGFSKLQLTPSQLGPSLIVPDGSNMFILFNNPALAEREVQRVGLESFLVKSLILGSPPVSVGAVPKSKKVFVGQEHPDGRITFIDWTNDKTESVTGFELNSRIRE